ncbi:type II toxin-antitoxin system ParD family antitoxin [Xanthomonas sp. AmX2]|uniref:ribbon-helix-helix domain-containing protein n=1 Tax=Xanthomonas sp. TaxID=29446 RepID=UPI00197D6999|nr:type II toxin-antitoxin system ParD family antitoxin [Xanthomonas sp.]MBN6149323.1 type II toxin-antitoxin system ParD family antitoxin [Xanthomonas sp.]
MATKNISSSDERKPFVDQQVAEHACGSSGESVCELIHGQRDAEELRGALLEGADSGPATALEPDFFDMTRKRARDRAFRGSQSA